MMQASCRRGDAALVRDERFAGLNEVDDIARIVTGVPCVLRGVASEWPAVRRWTFDHLASLAPTLPVKLVHGNREFGATRFVASTFGEYVEALSREVDVAGQGREPTHLKEFDLLKRFSGLHRDLRASELFPKRHIVSSSAWIGPRGARTGLHYDLLDNIATLVRGKKRFYLARPGAVEAVGGVSTKYDRWAWLANAGIDALARQSPASVFVVDLEPGDALYVPRGWWHEVVNLEPSILLSGFFGPWPRVLRLWLGTGLQQALHNLDVFGQRRCTCHPCLA